MEHRFRFIGDFQEARERERERKAKEEAETEARRAKLAAPVSKGEIEAKPSSQRQYRVVYTYRNGEEGKRSFKYLESAEEFAEALRKKPSKAYHEKRHGYYRYWDQGSCSDCLNMRTWKFLRIETRILTEWETI